VWSPVGPVVPVGVLPDCLVTLLFPVFTNAHKLLSKSQYAEAFVFASASFRLSKKNDEICETKVKVRKEC